MIEKSKVKILCVENDIIYESIENAAIDLSLNRDRISLCLSNKIDSYKGYHFKYLSDIKYIKKICINCGNEYNAQRVTSLYCSSKCNKDYKKLFNI